MLPCKQARKGCSVWEWRCLTGKPRLCGGAAPETSCNGVQTRLVPKSPGVQRLGNWGTERLYMMWIGVVCKCLRQGLSQDGWQAAEENLLKKASRMWLSKDYSGKTAIGHSGDTSLLPINKAVLFMMGEDDDASLDPTACVFLAGGALAPAATMSGRDTCVVRTLRTVTMGAPPQGSES